MEDPIVPYRETIKGKATVEGKHKKQSGGHGQYGHVKIEFEPGVSEDMIVINSAPNKKLRWEKTQSVNAGFDFSVLNQAINLSVDYYYRKGTDLIALRMLPLETGFTSMNVNWASMENKGVEISLSTRNITTKKLLLVHKFSILPITVIRYCRKTYRSSRPLRDVKAIL